MLTTVRAKCSLLRLRHAMCYALFVLVASTALAATTSPTTQLALEPEDAGDDYAIQGEYVGQYTRTDGPVRKLAAQIVALGNGAFNGAILAGGLPGDGWDGKTRIDLYGRSKSALVSVRVKGYSAAIADGILKGQDDKGEPFELRKTARQSPTLSAKPPENAISLFDGTGVDRWAQGQMDKRKLLAAVIPGAAPVASGPITKRNFGDFVLHLEFRTPYKPFSRSEERGNSGVFLQDRYEIQILDSFGRAAGIGECGAFYGVAAPRVNACLAPLVWQTLDVDFQAAKFDDSGKKTRPAIVTVRHNGIVIHEKLELPGPTILGKPESPQPGPLMLQSHENPVFFRNIWVVEARP